MNETDTIPGIPLPPPALVIEMRILLRADDVLADIDHVRDVIERIKTSVSELSIVQVDSVRWSK